VIPRSAEKTLVSLAKGYPVVAVTGPRQSGKSTLVKHVFASKQYVTLEDIEIREYAENDPKGFLAQFPDGAILDEVQRVPHLFSYIQTLVDKKAQTGVFVLTGSQEFELFEDITQSLAGRVATVVLLPFSSSELKIANLLPDSIEQLLLTGFYPPIYDRSLEPSTWYSNYVRTYIERDVRQMIQIRDLSTFQRFVKMCAARTGQLLNLSALASECGITHNTANAWISILEASFVVYLLKPHHKNFNKRLVKTPKLYFLDPGLAAWLLAVQDSEQMSMHQAKGALFETFVVSELLKRRFNQALDANIYFWRDRAGNEIDVLIDTGTSLTPVEIKSGKTAIPDFFEMFRKWKNISGSAFEKGRLVYGGTVYQDRPDCTVIPWDRIDDM
jgi:predicted AAA+ superfamily ATPase